MYNDEINNRVHAKVTKLVKICGFNHKISDVYLDWEEADTDEELLKAEAKADDILQMIRETLDKEEF